MSDSEQRRLRYERAALAASVVGLAALAYVVVAQVRAHGGEALPGGDAAIWLGACALLLFGVFTLLAQREKKKQSAD